MKKIGSFCLRLFTFQIFGSGSQLFKFAAPALNFLILRLRLGSFYSKFIGSCGSGSFSSSHSLGRTLAALISAIQIQIYYYYNFHLEFRHMASRWKIPYNSIWNYMEFSICLPYGIFHLPAIWNFQSACHMPKFQMHFSHNTSTMRRWV